MKSIDDFIDEQAAGVSIASELVGSFGFVALVLSAIRIYSLISYSTLRRTPEMGIRMALGAQRGDVMWTVLRQGLKPGLMGVDIGINFGPRIDKAAGRLPVRRGACRRWKLGRHRHSVDAKGADRQLFPGPPRNQGGPGDDAEDRLRTDPTRALRDCEKPDPPTPPRNDQPTLKAG